MREEVLEGLEKFNEEEKNGEELLQLICVRSKNNHHKIIAIIDDFLSKCPTESLHSELFYCLICVLRKNGAL
jgi:hypothetical protein